MFNPHHNKAAGASLRSIKAFWRATSASVSGRLGHAAGFRWPFAEDRGFGALSLLVLLLPLAFSLKTYENFETVKFCLFLILIGWAMWEFSRSKPGTREIRVFLPKIALLFFGLFLFFAFLSTVYNPDRFTGFFGVYTRYTSGFLFYFCLMAFLFLLATVAQKEKYIFLLKILIFDSLLIAVYGLLESGGIGLYSGKDALGLVRAPSFLGNPNFSSFFLAGVLPLSLVFLAVAKSKAGKVYYGVCAFFMIWALAMFISRGALLASFVSLLVLGIMFAWHRLHRKYLAVTALAFILMAAFVFSFAGFVRPQAVVNTVKLNDSNINLRLYVWNIAFKAIGEHPVLGVGLGNFIEYYELNRGKYVADQSESFDDPHNLFLFQAAAGGIIFALSFVGLLLLVLWSLARAFRFSGEPLLAALSASLAAWVFAASFTPVPVPVFLLLGVLLGSGILTNARPVVLEVSSWYKWGGRFLGGMLLVFGAVFLLTEHLFYAGYQAYYLKQFDKAKRMTSLAWTICPCNRFYQLYNLGSRIKLEKDNADIAARIAVWENSRAVRWQLRAANLRFLVYLETRNPLFADQAIRDIKQVLAVNPNHAERLTRLAFYNFEAGDFEGAMEYANQSLSLNPSLFPAWMLKAKLHQRLNQKRPMMDALKRVSAQFPSDVYIKQLIADAARTDQIQNLPIVVFASYDRLE